MAGVGSVGAAGAAGGVGMGVGGAGAVSAGGGASMVGSTAPVTATSAPVESTKVTLSPAAQRMASEPTQAGASFSVTSDKGGHQYVAGMDANGFRAPTAVDPLHNVNGQSYAELNKLDDMLAAALLAALLGDKHDKGQESAACVLAASQVVHAINAYSAMSKL